MKNIHKRNLGFETKRYFNSHDLPDDLFIELKKNNSESDYAVVPYYRYFYYIFHHEKFSPLHEQKYLKETFVQNLKISKKYWEKNQQYYCYTTNEYDTFIKDIIDNLQVELTKLSNVSQKELLNNPYLGELKTISSKTDFSKLKEILTLFCADYTLMYLPYILACLLCNYDSLEYFHANQIFLNDSTNGIHYFATIATQLLGKNNSKYTFCEYQKKLDAFWSYKTCSVKEHDDFWKYFHYRIKIFCVCADSCMSTKKLLSHDCDFSYSFLLFCNQLYSKDTTQTYSFDDFILFFTIFFSPTIMSSSILNPNTTSTAFQGRVYYPPKYLFKRYSETPSPFEANLTGVYLTLFEDVQDIWEDCGFYCQFRYNEIKKLYLVPHYPQGIMSIIPVGRKYVLKKFFSYLQNLVHISISEESIMLIMYEFNSYLLNYLIDNNTNTDNYEFTIKGINNFLDDRLKEFLPIYFDSGKYLAPYTFEQRIKHITF